jgi:hypothetical protein
MTTLFSGHYLHYFILTSDFVYECVLVRKKVTQISGNRPEAKRKLSSFEICLEIEVNQVGVVKQKSEMSLERSGVL